MNVYYVYALANMPLYPCAATPTSNTLVLALHGDQICKSIKLEAIIYS